MDSSPEGPLVRSKIPEGFFDLTEEEQLEWARDLAAALAAGRDDHEGST